jgi:hypothetical protein
VNARLSQTPKGWARPVRPPLVALDALIGRRLPRCGCGGRLWITPPMLDPGRVSCLLCDRVVAEVVYRLPEIADWSDEQERPKPGRPPKHHLTPEQRAATRQRQLAYHERLRTGETVKQRWSRFFDACVICGRSDSPHNSLGRCQRCRMRIAKGTLEVPS